ncbi:MAG: class I SAM-dependent methyltransferase [Halanaerobiales bacterium]|nr:class I SAM-dependent methyltransferase [Halanaerobiales bacterium]
MDKHGKLFNKIAPYYQLFFKYQVYSYGKIVDNNIYLIKDENINTVLDIGCGTGAFGYVFQTRGYSVKGIDVAPEMVKRGMENNLECETGDIKEGLKCDDNSYDMVISSMVAHGIDQELRLKFFKETKRIAKKIVLIQDYKFERNLLVDIVEKLEAGGYFNYIKCGQEQLQSIFGDMIIKEVSRNTNWYIYKKRLDG